jgi:hypothetical protein
VEVGKSRKSGEREPGQGRQSRTVIGLIAFPEAPLQTQRTLLSDGVIQGPNVDAVVDGSCSSNDCADVWAFCRLRLLNRGEQYPPDVERFEDENVREVRRANRVRATLKLIYREAGGNSAKSQGQSINGSRMLSFRVMPGISGSPLGTTSPRGMGLRLV